MVENKQAVKTKNFLNKICGPIQVALCMNYAFVGNIENCAFFGTLAFFNFFFHFDWKEDGCIFKP
jgi:hypothetical protein